MTNCDRCKCPKTCCVSYAEKPSQTSPLSYKLKYAFLCPPHGILERILSNGVLIFLTWAVPWSILGEACLPGSTMFGLIAVIDACVIGGILISAINIPRLPPLPPLLGMLIAGFCLRNVPYINVAKDIDSEWSSALRSIALTIILVKAGLELDASALKKMKGVCLRLTSIPCLVETATCAVASKLLLNFPWEWGVMLGFVLGAVTPAVIVPSLLTLQEKGYGVKKGIPTLVIAASSFDDVLAISGFSLVLGITFSQASSQSGAVTTSPNATAFPNATEVIVSQDENTAALVWKIFRGPVEMVCGIVLGALIGFLLWFIPGRDVKQTIRDRTLLTVGFGVLVLFGSARLKFPGAGALAAIVLSFIAATSWKEEKEHVSRYVGILWTMFEPIMFGLIGAEISIESMDPATVGLGLAVLFVGLFFRSLASFASVTCSNFTKKEKLFICFAWLPKATVQAALGPVALDTALKLSPELEDLAKQVLTIAVLSILITAPLGAAIIGLSGPKLLQKSDVAVSDDHEAGPVDIMSPDESETEYGQDVPLKPISGNTTPVMER